MAKMSKGANPVRGMADASAREDRYSEAEWGSLQKPSLGPQGFSEYVVGDQGQPAVSEDTGGVAIECQEEHGTFGSHEMFSDIMRGGQTGEEE